MSDNEAQATNGGHLIERSGDAQPMYLSEKIGLDFGTPFGGWTPDPAEATPYESAEKAQSIIDGPLGHVAPFCKVVAK